MLAQILAPTGALVLCYNLAHGEEVEAGEQGQGTHDGEAANSKGVTPAGAT